MSFRHTSDNTVAISHNFNMKTNQIDWYKDKIEILEAFGINSKDDLMIAKLVLGHCNRTNKKQLGAKVQKLIVNYENKE